MLVPPSAKVEIMFLKTSETHLKVCHDNSRGKLKNEKLLWVSEGHRDGVSAVLGGVVSAGPVHGNIELREGVEEAGVCLHGAGLLQGGRGGAGVLTEDDHRVDEEQTSGQLVSCRVQCHVSC